MAEVPITLHGKTVVETVAVAPAYQLNAKVLLSMPLDNRAANALIDNFLNTWDDTATNKAEPNNDTKSKPQHTSDVLALVARKQPERKANKILNYLPDTSNSETENSQHFDDERASDSTYSFVTDTELLNSDSEEEETLLSDQSHTVYSLAEYDSSDDNVNRENTSQNDKHQGQEIQQTSAQLTDK